MNFPSVSAPHFVPVFPLGNTDQSIWINSELKILRWLGGCIPQSGTSLTSGYGLYLFSLTFVGYFSQSHLFLCSGSLLLSWHLGLAGSYIQFPIPHSPLLHTCVLIPDPLYIFPVFSHIWSCPPFPSKSCLHPKSIHTLPQMSILFYLLRMNEAGKLWLSFFLSFICSVNIILGIRWVKDNIHISVSTYHVCTFVTGLHHSGWYFLVPPISKRISWIHCF